MSPERTLLFLFRAGLGGKIFKGEAQQLADARILFLRVTFQHRPLVGRDANGDLPMGRLRRLAPLEVEIIHGEADDFTGRLEAVTITSRFDLRDEIQGEIKRQWGRTFLCASGHNSKAAGSSRSWALAPAHTDLRREQRKFLRNGNFDAPRPVETSPPPRRRENTLG